MGSSNWRFGGFNLWIRTIQKVSLIRKTKLIEENSFFSDDSVLTIAIIDAILNNGDYKFVGEFSQGGSFASGRVVASSTPKALEQYAKVNNLTLERVFSEPKDFKLV